MMIFIASSGVGGWTLLLHKIIGFHRLDEVVCDDLIVGGLISVD